MRYSIQNAISHIVDAGIANLMSLFSIALTTGMLGTVLLQHSLIAQQLEFAKDAPAILLTLKDTLSESKGHALLSKIEKDERILNAHYISKQEVLARSESQFKELGTLIKDGFAGASPFPAAIELYIGADIKTQQMLEKLTLDIKAHEEIEDVLLTAQGTWNERLRNAERPLIAALATAIVACGLFIHYTLVKTFINRQDEIALVPLLGGSPRYFLMPLLLNGIILGTLGTAAGIACCYGLFLLFKAQLGTLEFLPMYQYILIVGSGTGIGIVAALFAHRRTPRRL